MPTPILSTAQHLVNQSLDELDRGHYLKSWALTLPARAAFACDAVINAVELPFAMLSVVFRSLELIVTWGRSCVYLQNSLKNLDLTINQSLNSTVGAIISPQLGSFLQTESFMPFECIAAGIAFIALARAIAKIDVQVFPNWIFVSPQGDWSFGWTWLR